MKKLVVTKRFEITWHLTNWTFGIWWDRKKLKKGGIDLGPLEIIYIKKLSKKV